jgi:nickel-dependent lactate racemase
MTISLPYGRGSLPLRIPEAFESRVTVLESRPARPLRDPGAELEEALRNPVAFAPLANLAVGKHSACIVVSDITRPVPNAVLLPPVLRVLESAGIARHGITLLIATGMHRPTEGAELVELLGEEIAGSYRVVNHDCRDSAELRQVDVLSGTPIEINRHYLDADLKILTGLIEPHAFAGFSGGGKSVLPGIASFGSMAYMHSYALLDQPGVACGSVAGNPFREDVDRICRAAGADFLVNTTIDAARRITGWFVGDVREAFRRGCDVAAEHQVLPIEVPADLVITTGGGYPLDQTFHQACKGLVSAREMVRAGGTLALAAECTEGLGGAAFCEVVRTSGSAAGFRKHYADPSRFAQDQWTAQAFFQTLEHTGRVALHAPSLPANEVLAFGLEPVADLDGLLETSLREGERVYVVPEGPYVTGYRSAVTH